MSAEQPLNLAEAWKSLSETSGNLSEFDRRLFYAGALGLWVIITNLNKLYGETPSEARDTLENAISEELRLFRDELAKEQS